METLTPGQFFVFFPFWLMFQTIVTHTVTSPPCLLWQQQIKKTNCCCFPAAGVSTFEASSVSTVG